MSPAYFASGLAGSARERIRRAVVAITEGHPGTAEGILETLLDGPYALVPLTLEVEVCASCGDFISTDELVGAAASPDVAHVITDGECDLCERKRLAENPEENAE